MRRRACGGEGEEEGVREKVRRRACGREGEEEGVWGRR